MLDQLEEMEGKDYKWDGLKRLKSNYTPKFSKFKDSSGNRIPPKEYVHKAAEYLANVQWEKPENLPSPKSNPTKYSENEGKSKTRIFTFLS